MKTLAEKLADLKAKFLDAKTDDERKKISDEIDSIIADANKVQDKLKTANEEAKTSRENAAALQKLIDDAKNPPENEDPEDDVDDEKIPAWAKTLTSNIETLSKTVTEIQAKDQAGKKSKMIGAALKEAGISEKFLPSIVVEGEDQEAINEAVTAFKQTLIDEQLLSADGVKHGMKGTIENTSIKDYAEGKNLGADNNSGIKGKNLIPQSE